MFQLASQIFQRSPSQLGDRVGAGALLRVQILAALRAQSLAVIPAEELERSGQQNLLADRIFQLQAFALIIADFGFGRGDGNFFPATVNTLRTVKQIKRSVYLFDHRFKASRTGLFKLG